MSGQEELTESLDDEEEGLISEKMVKKITYLIHKLAELKGQEYKEIQKKCRGLFKYTNLAKVSKDQGHAIINKLLELTGGEEKKQEQQGATVKDDEKPTNKDHNVEVIDEDVVTSIMRGAIRDAVDITLKEVVKKDVPVQGLGGVVLEIGKVIFDAKMVEEAGK